MATSTEEHCPRLAKPKAPFFSRWTPATTKQAMRKYVQRKMLHEHLVNKDGLEPAQEFALEAAGAWLALFSDKKDLAHQYRSRIRILMEGTIGLRPDVKYQYRRIVEAL